MAGADSANTQYLPRFGQCQFPVGAGNAQVTCAARPRRAHHSTEKWPSLSLGTGRGAHHSKPDRAGLVVQDQGNAHLFVALRSFCDQESISAQE